MAMYGLESAINVAAPPTATSLIFNELTDMQATSDDVDTRQTLDRITNSLMRALTFRTMNQRYSI
ncbi:hypothetical protein ASG35_09455 [Burkholderia sp. Leaf177]|nr:hypothetical protein ASG35_09455 [Burkholderia sp. Leaf177]